jgi:hypothetical protein
MKLFFIFKSILLMAVIMLWFAPLTCLDHSADESQTVAIHAHDSVKSGISVVNDQDSTLSGLRCSEEFLPAGLVPPKCQNLLPDAFVAQSFVYNNQLLRSDFINFNYYKVVIGQRFTPLVLRC